MCSFLLKYIFKNIPTSNIFLKTAFQHYLHLTVFQSNTIQNDFISRFVLEDEIMNFYDEKKNSNSLRITFSIFYLLMHFTLSRLIYRNADTLFYRHSNVELLKLMCIKHVTGYSVILLCNFFDRWFKSSSKGK